ncbi:hypothetical protein BDN70DRAFT_819199 [Pholiota conissans]|uniref:Uncharacterized protein n=1 Tax=Pholiota conissans TaxID=109636 RepID=A0A9P5YLL1_9AGAR|nr:hypothetical protein BDN70DRAFT_819199 [Pholiota conissans]
MVNPGVFLGTRKAFLAAQQDLYASAVTENHVADTVANIQRRYFKRYPISLPHNEEPSAEWLASVDDDAPDGELLPPDRSKLDAMAFEAAQAIYDEQVKVLKFRKEQITRRLQYQYKKSNAPAKRVEIGSNDPIAIMQAKLTGVPVKKPRLRQACNIWAQRNRQFVDPIYEERVKNEDVPQQLRAAVRSRVYRECFNELDEDERKEYEKEAAEELKATQTRIEETLNGPASEDPIDRQRVLAGLPNFVQPMLDLITDHSGWKATLIAGGPEPADHGRLNIMSFHSGETSGNVKMNFGRAERRAYKDYVVPIFGSFLKKCYTVEECRAMALSDPEAVSLAEVLRNDGGEYCIESAEDAEKSADEPANEFPLSVPPSPCRSMAPSPAPSLCASPSDTPSTSMDGLVPASPSPSSALNTSKHPHRATTPCPSPQPTEKRRRNKSVTEESASSLNDGPCKRLRSSTQKTETSRNAHPAEPSTVASKISTRSRGVVEVAAPLTTAEVAAAPDWFLPIYQMLVSSDLGPAWLQLVRTWAHFENAERFAERGKLGTTGRPACISLWIKYARSASFRPDLVLRQDASGDLTNLRRPGKNGLLSVLAALFFWGVSAQGVRNDKHWRAAVDDVHWVISCLSSD